MYTLGRFESKGADTPHLPLSGAKAGSNHLNESNTPLPTRIDERYSQTSVADPDPNPDPDPPDPYVFGPRGSGSTSQRYGSFYLHAKIVRKTLTPTIL